MSFSQNTSPARQALVARAKAIIMTPDQEWPVIAAEPATPASLYSGYIAILAAIPPIATFLHAVLFGYGAFGIIYRPSVAGALTTAIVHYVLTLAGVYVLALIVNALAPTFQGQKSFVQALKLVAYASTAQWLCGIFALIPGLGILGLLGLYSLYLFFRGLPVLMQSPADKSLGYTAVVILCAILVGVVISPLSMLLVHGTMGGGAPANNTGAADDTPAGTLSLPGGGTVQLGKLQQAANALASNAQSGTATPRIPTETLKAMLPDIAPGGLARTGISSAGGQLGGFGGSTAEAKYGGHGADLSLSVTDLGPLGALASMGSVLGVNGDEETATTSAKLYQEDGNSIAESYDRQNQSGSYGMVVAGRFLVKAEGSGVPLSALKAAVKGVDLARLASLAH